MANLDSSLFYFGALCDQVTEEPSLTIKQEIISGFISRYSGDRGLLFKFLLPKFNGRLYHVQDKQMLKIFALALKVSEKSLKDDLNASGCIGLTVKKYFTPRSPTVKAAANGWSKLTLQDLDGHLEALSANQTEDLQLAAIQKFLDVACKNAVFMYLRQVKQDLRLGAGIRIVLSGLHPSANDIFKRCANIQEVVRRISAGEAEVDDDNDDEGNFSFDDEDGPRGGRSPSPARKKGRVEALITIGMPLSPMLAAPSKGCEHVLSKCPNGAYSEVKYDGERIQIHKNGDKWSFWARSLKPVKADKYEGLEKYLKQAIVAESCILDGEILMVDIETSKPLPFGTLGKHKKAQFTTAVTGIFIFDIMLKNGKTVIDEPLDVRRELIKSSVNFIPNRIMISEMLHVTGSPEQRKVLMQKHLNYAVAQGLEGLVIKDVKSTYEPGSRHWIKLKKDYLVGMADSADLVVLGAYYGSGTKGGVLSTFLVGVWDKTVAKGGVRQFKTVCKVGNGHDDATLAALNIGYKHTMTPCVGNTAPSWIEVHNSHMPDTFVKDPMQSDVWEIIGAEFSHTKTHTAAGISFRFPRVLKRRDDKDVATATSLQELIKLVEVSKQNGHTFEAGDDAEDAPAAPPPAATSRNIAVPLAAAMDRAAAPTRQNPPNSGSLEHVVSDVAQPLASPKAPGQGLLICHSTCVGGKWSNRGTMGSISKFIGDEPSEAYAEMSRTVALGEVIFCEVSNRQSMGKMYVATMIGQRAAGKPGDVPQVDQDNFNKCLSKCGIFATKHDLSMHVAKLDRATGVDWASAEKVLKQLNLRVVVYSRDGGQLARSKTYAETQPGAVTNSLPAARVESIPRASANRPSVSASLPTSSLSMFDDGDNNNDAILAGTRIYIGAAVTERLRLSITQKLLMMGGVAVAAQDATTTHVVVVAPTDGECASIASSKAFFVSTRWIDDCFEKDKHLLESKYLITSSDATTVPASCSLTATLSTSSALSVCGTQTFDAFSGCRIVVPASNFSANDVSELRNKVTMCGGIFQDQWKMTGADKSTHMVVAKWCPAAERVSQLGGTVVTRQWVDDSFGRGKQVDIAQYVIDEDAAFVGASSPASPPRPRTGVPQAHSQNIHSTRSESVPASTPATSIASSKILVGVTFAVEGYSKGERQQIVGLIESMGGAVVPVFKPETCRYMICETLTSVSAALNDKSNVLTKGWLLACRGKGKLVRTEDYKYFGDDEDDVVECAAPPKSSNKSAAVVVDSGSDTETETDFFSNPPPRQAALEQASPSITSTVSVTSTVDDNGPAGSNEACTASSILASLPPALLDSVSGAVFCSGDTALKAQLERAFVAFGGHLGGAGEPPAGGSHSFVLITHGEKDVRDAHEVVNRAPPASVLRLAVVVGDAWLAACIKQGKLLPTLAFFASA